MKRGVAVAVLVTLLALPATAGRAEEPEMCTVGPAAPTVVACTYRSTGLEGYVALTPNRWRITTTRVGANGLETAELASGTGSAVNQPWRVTPFPGERITVTVEPDCDGDSCRVVGVVAAGYPIPKAYAL